MSEEKINLAPFGIAGMVAVFVLAITLTMAVCADATWTFGENLFNDIDLHGGSAMFVFVGYTLASVLVLITGTGIALKTNGSRFWSGLFIDFGMICSMVSVFDIVGDGTPEGKMIQGLIFVFFGAAIVAGAIADFKAGRTINVAIAMIALFTPLILLCATNFATTNIVSLATFLIWLAVESITFALIPEKVYMDDAVLS